LTIFALDTATPSPGLALLQGDDVLAELWLGPEPGSGRRVLEAVHHLLAAAGRTPRAIERIVVGIGPGGFTGLRIGIATALGLGQALRVPVEGASSLEALALGMCEVAPAGALLAPVLDARRGEVFGACYRPLGEGALEELIPPTAIAPAALAAALAELEDPVWVAGDGVARYGASFAEAGLPAPPADSRGHRISAVHLARRVAVAGPRPVVPDYARLPDAEVNRRARLAAGAPG
jgi:tRNA threonylcarbamoyladenosine biosynthesis protein TsaB